jgi:import inner membrane translocase subunit TIM54
LSNPLKQPVLYRAAVDYEVREGRNAGDIESMICEEIRQKRKAAKDGIEPNTQVVGRPGNPFAPVPVKHNESDAIVAVGRIAWGEVLNGLAKGCEASLKDEVIVESKDSTEKEGEQAIDSVSSEADKLVTAPEKLEQLSDQEPVEVSFREETGTLEENVSKAGEQPIFVSTSTEFTADSDASNVALIEEEEEEPSFSLPPTIPAVMYIPHENIIGWVNVPYRLYMWAADYKRVEWIGEYAIAVALNQRKPLEQHEIDVGQNEKRYWVGDEAKERVANDKPITLEDKVREHLSTFVRSEN